MRYNLFIQLMLFLTVALGCISCNKDPLMGDVVDDSELGKQLYAKLGFDI